jgi:hypothetical protein
MGIIQNRKENVDIRHLLTKDEPYRIASWSFNRAKGNPPQLTVALCIVFICDPLYALGDP